MYIWNEHIYKMETTHAVYYVQIRKGLKRDIEKRIYINFITAYKKVFLFIDGYL